MFHFSKKRKGCGKGHKIGIILMLADKDARGKIRQAHHSAGLG
jgi:hypothetical protein